MELKLRNIKGEVVGGIQVRDDVFNVPMNTALVHQVMVGQRANQRQGTAKAKTRSEVSGGGIKPRPQKYSGRSRQGSIRAPQWRKGGVVFPPLPRSYRQHTPRRMKRQSLVMVLSDKAREGQLVVLENLALEQPKTRNMVETLKALDAGPSTLLVADGAGESVLRCARNVPGLRLLPASLLNTVDLLDSRRVVMTLDAVRKAEELWGGPFVRRKQRPAVKEEVALSPSMEDESPAPATPAGEEQSPVPPPIAGGGQDESGEHRPTQPSA